MARIFIDSFETQNLNLWDSVTDQCSIVSTTGLSLKDDYCVYISDDDYYIEKNISPSTEYYFTFLFRLDNVFDCHIIRLLNGGSELIRSQWSSNKLQWLTGGSWFCYNESAFTYVLHTTYFMQIYIKIASTGGRIYVKVDDIVDRDSIGDMFVSSAANRVRFGGKAWYDNIVMDDSVMPEQTEIIILRPNGVGGYSDFISTPSGSNYTCVDEIPYNDSDYVSSGIVNAVDTYTLEDIPNAESIKCVQMQARARKDSDSPLTKFNFVMREGLTNYHGNDILLSNTFTNYSEMWLDGPTKSGIWYPPAVNSMEIGVRTRT